MTRATVHDECDLRENFKMVVVLDRLCEFDRNVSINVSLR